MKQKSPTKQQSREGVCFSISIYLETEELHFQKKRAYQQVSPRLLKHNIHLAFPIMQVLLSKGTPWHETNRGALLSRALAALFSCCNREHPQAGEHCTWLKAIGNVRFGFSSSKLGWFGSFSKVCSNSFWDWIRSDTSSGHELSIILD